MMMDTTVDADGTAFICPECSFNGKSLPELISHLNEAHSEETANKSEAPTTNHPSIVQPEKRSRRKPAFSHQIVSQASRQSSTLFNQRTSSNTESESNELWNRSSTSEKTSTPFLSALTDDSSLSMISDENTNINLNSKNLTLTTQVAKRNPNVLHSILSQQRPIAPKNGSPTGMKMTPASSPSILPMINSSPGTDNSFFSPTNSSIQPYRKNFQCRMCRLTYKNFHDCTAHIRKKHEISHAQAGRYVEKLDTDAPLPPSATGNYKFRVKVKSLSSENSLKTFQCKYCLYTSHWSKDITRHQRENHPNYPPHIIQKDYVHQDHEINNNHQEQYDDNEGLSALMIDPVQAFGEVIDNNNDDDDDEQENDDEDMEENEEEEEEGEMNGANGIDDDEEDALWKYQQEINHLSESDISLMNNNNNHSTYALARRFKKFRCPHCDHSAPTLTKLKLHVATHINIKPFMCSICGWRANLRWYIQCHGKKRHPNQNVEILQLSPEEAEQTIDAYMKERRIDNKLINCQDSKRRYQCTSCQFRSTHPKFLEQHIAQNHPNKLSLKKSLQQFNSNDEKHYSKFIIKPPNKLNYSDEQNKSQGIYNRSSLIQSDGTVLLPDPSQIVYKNFSSHPNFNPNRLFYCALCYRGYRWRYDVKRHHKTMHETPEDEAALGLSMSPKSVKYRNKEFNRNFRYLEYVPQLDGLISASMSSVNSGHFLIRHDNHFEQEKNLEHFIDEDNNNNNNNESRMDDDIKLSIADARTVDVTEDEAAALLMIESYKSSDHNSILVNDHPEDSVIVFDDDRQNYTSHQLKEKSPEITRNSQRISSSGFKPYRCPYCFYRTNWRTDSLRHIRARHKIEPTHDGYYELTAEEAENTYAEYERTFGFVVSKKVLGRFTEFRHMEWKDLQKSIWEKIKDKQGFEQIIYERLRPDNCTEPTTTTTTTSANLPGMPKKLMITSANNKINSIEKRKRMFTCMECGFRSTKLIELDKHICTKYQNVSSVSHGKFLVSIYQCNTCSYRTIERNYARKHISLHRFKRKKLSKFFYCLFCGYNHQKRDRLTVHIAKQHSEQNTLTLIRSFRYKNNADFSIKQVLLHRSFLDRQLQNPKSSVFYCHQCPQISTSILEYKHHQSCHEENSFHRHKCNHCSFASNSLLYTHQHKLLHSKSNRLLALNINTTNLKQIAVSTIFKETLGKNRRYHCPFCKTFSSSTSSIVLDHIKNNHTGNSSQFDDSLIIGSDMAKEILALKTVTDNQRMDTS